MSFGAEAAPVIPLAPGGAPWRITTRQFRRTIAWHIANRPFGTIAGMIQYKHASVAAFEGYAGSSPSGFRAEVEAQRALGQIDDILDYFDDRRAGGSPSGPAGPRIARALDAAADTLGPLPAMIADRARLRTLLASLARTLHVGPLADCFFDPSTALCLKRATAPDRTTPLTAQAAGYASGVWGTYRQWLAVGAQVRKGERGTTVVLWKQMTSTGDDDGDGDEDPGRPRIFARAFTLFNVTQVDGYAPKPVAPLPETERFAHADAFIDALKIPRHLRGL